MRNGFTLVEVVIAAALLLLTMGALMGAVVTSRRAVASANHQISAVQTARAKMEHLSFLPFGDANWLYGTHAFATGNYAGNYIVTTNTEYPNLVKDIVLTVIWTNPGRATTSSITLNGSFSSVLHN